MFATTAITLLCTAGISILRAILRCDVQGVQASSDGVLGACATWRRRRVDT